MAESFYQKSSLKQLRKLKAASPNAEATVTAYRAMSASAMAEGVLNVKTKHLIAIAVGHATKCPYCIDHHTKEAKKAGASEAEVSESILVALALSAGAAYTHAGMALEAFEEAQ